jgi:integrase
VISQTSDPAPTLDLGHGPNLADLRAAILSDEALPVLRRRAIASAFNTVGKALGRPLEALPTDPARLRPQLAGLTPAMVGLSKGSWQNALSLLHAGLNRLHGDMLPRRLDLMPSAAWVECLALIPKGSRAGYHLGRFARYATWTGIEPEAVDDAFLARYTDDLTHRTLTAEPARQGRDTGLAWNEAAARYQEWPQLRLTIPNNRVRYSLPWDSYPTSLQTEVGKWLDLLGRDPFAERDFRPLKPKSIAARHSQLGLYLGALVELGEDPAAMTSLAAVITLTHAKRSLQVIYKRSGEKPTVHLSQIANTVLMLAHHWLKLSEEDVGKLRRMARNVTPEAEGLAPRNEERLAQLNDPAAMSRVLNLPNTLFRQARRAGPPSVTTARRVQAAVAIELFLMTGMRMSNVVGLEIGRSLLLRADGGIDILIPRTEVKNRISIAADLPATSAALIRSYIRDHRPLLGDASTAWLFPGTKPGTRKSSDGLRSQVSLAMAREAGVAWHPHLFRHLMAKLQLDVDARSDGLVTRALGHKRADTTRLHYSGFQAKQAIRHHDELVLARRTSSYPTRPGGRV